MLGVIRLSVFLPFFFFFFGVAGGCLSRVFRRLALALTCSFSDELISVWCSFFFLFFLWASAYVLYLFVFVRLIRSSVCSVVTC
jgi:hypothetical protein